MKILFQALLIILILGSCHNTNGQKDAPPASIMSNYQQIAANIDAFLVSQAHYGRFSGTVLVAIKDSVIYHNSFGFGDFERQKANTNASVYDIASISKPFTATAIMKLVEGGHLKLSDKLSAFFPQLGEITQNIEIRHLLSMTSGINEDFMRSKTYNIDNVVFPEAEPIALNDLINYFGELTLYEETGKKFDYSNMNYALLAAIVEKVSGVDYRTFLSQNIWQPLNMQSTDFGNRHIAPNLLSKPYLGIPNQFGTPPVWHHTWATGAGGIFSSSKDLYKLMYGLHTGSLLDSATLQLMFGKHVKNNAQYYGYGWQLAKRQGHEYRYHDGGTLGYVGEAGFFPELDLYIVIQTNHTHNLSEIGKSVQLKNFINKEIRNIIFGQEVSHLPTPQTHINHAFAGDFAIGDYKYEFVTENDTTKILAKKGMPSVLDVGFFIDLKEDSRRFGKAQKLAQAFGNEDFKYIRKKGQAMLRVALSTDQLGQMWNDLTGDKGEFISYNFYRLPSPQKPNHYWVRLIHEKTEIGLLLILSKNGRIKGMHIDQKFSSGGPTKVALTSISTNHLFLDGFRYGYPDSEIFQKQNQWYYRTTADEYLIHRLSDL